MLTKLHTEELGIIPKRFVNFELEDYEPALKLGGSLTFSSSAASFTDLTSTGDTTIGNAIGDSLTILGVGTWTTGTTETTLDVVGTALTTGKVLDVSDLAAITTGTVIHVDATGVTQTSGKLIHLDSASTALTSAGRLFLSDHTGAATVSGVLNEFKSAAADETSIVTVTATAALALGTCINVVAASMTTGTALKIDSADALTDGILVDLESGATAMTSTGRLLKVDHSGNASVSGVIAEFLTAAADETVLAKFTASAALAAGKVIQGSAAAMTTGIFLDVADLDALTTGQAINILSDSSDTGTRALVKIDNTNTASTGTTPLEINNDATAGSHIKLTGTGVQGIDFTGLGATDFLWDATAASGCTAAPQTNAAIGFLTFKVGGTQQWLPYYNAT